MARLMKRDRERVQKVVGCEGVLVPHLDVDDARWRIQHTTDPSRQKTSTVRPECPRTHARTRPNATQRRTEVWTYKLNSWFHTGSLWLASRTRKEHMCV
jgi:hypothetical protein